MIWICWHEVAAVEECNEEHTSPGCSWRNEESTANGLVRSACRIYEL